MFTKFKSALYNVVGNFDPTDGGTASSPGIVSLASGVTNTPSLIQPLNTVQGREKTVKFPYSRPHFLQLNSEDEILVSADHTLRPIICPRDISQIPWNSGYAETVNAGKSKRNEDQAAVHVGMLTRSINQSFKLFPTSTSHTSKFRVPSKRISSTLNGIVQDEKEDERSLASSSLEVKPSTALHSVKRLSASELLDPLNNSRSPIVNHEESTISLPYYYFGVFDGHAGWGAAVYAANQLHHILHKKLCNVVELIIPDPESDDDLRGPLWPPEKTVSPDSAIIGALEQAFWTMDQQIGEDRQRHGLSGGCTACVALFILGKVFVSNAGDSRGVIALKASPVSMSFDFTPETETQRIRKIGARHPELLGGEFTYLEFLRRPLKSDVGKKAVYRDHYMKGWSLKTITEADLKYPLVCGEGKRSRVLATIGVTRGFGDHDLKAQFSALPIKPFLSPEPEVRVFDLKEITVTEKDVLILGTDGLWDIMSNEKAVAAVNDSLQQFSPNDSNRYKYRYTSAAHDLVLWSRGRLKDHNWRTADDKHATIDDISVFVIPLKPYKEKFERWQTEAVVESSEEVFEKALQDTSSGPPAGTPEALSNSNVAAEESVCSGGILPYQLSSEAASDLVSSKGPLLSTPSSESFTNKLSARLLRSSSSATATSESLISVSISSINNIVDHLPVSANNCLLVSSSKIFTVSDPLFVTDTESLSSSVSDPLSSTDTEPLSSTDPEPLSTSISDPLSNTDTEPLSTSVNEPLFSTDNSKSSFGLTTTIREPVSNFRSVPLSAFLSESLFNAVTHDSFVDIAASVPSTESRCSEEQTSSKYIEDKRDL